MNIHAPESAPARGDLPWLRRRTTRAAAAAAASAPSQSDPPHPGADLDLSASSRPLTTPLVQSGRPDWIHPPRSSSLDLTRHVPTPKSTQARADPRSQRPANTELFRAARTGKGSPTILTAQKPVVTLTRVQSGVGALILQAAHSDLVGDLRLGCAYQLVSGQSSVIHNAGGLSTAPAGSQRPVIIASSEPFEALTIDLAQSRQVERLIVCAYSESGTSLDWDGALIVQTYGGDRVEVPLRSDPAPGVMVPLSLYNIDGEFVLRAEQFFIEGSLREATAAFGFERITWLDDHTPLK